MNKPLLVVSLMLTLTFLSCSQGPESPTGFSLPQGNAVEGEKVFMQYQCLACHNLHGFDYDSVNKEFEPPVLLGVSFNRVQTYGDLVTSIINPSHRLATNYPLSLIQEEGLSKMLVFNDLMTVSELIDLVTFLQSKYEVKPLENTFYGVYLFEK